MKSISGTLGATEIQRLATDLEAAVRESRGAEETERLVNRLEAELHRLMPAILTALPQEAPLNPASEIDWTAVQEVLAEVEPLLDEGNIRVNYLIETHAPLLKHALGSLANELEHRVEHFLYHEAAETINRARERFPQLALY